MEWVNKQRLLSAYIDWEKEELLIVKIKFIVKNQIGILKDLSDIIFTMWMNIDWINTSKIWNSQTEINLELTIQDYDYLLIDRFIERVKMQLWKKLYEFNVWNIKKQ